LRWFVVHIYSPQLITQKLLPRPIYCRRRFIVAAGHSRDDVSRLGSQSAGSLSTLLAQTIVWRAKIAVTSLKIAASAGC
jgi:hypothetical protein